MTEKFDTMHGHMNLKFYKPEVWYSQKSANQ